MTADRIIWVYGQPKPNDDSVVIWVHGAPYNSILTEAEAPPAGVISGAKSPMMELLLAGVLG